MDRKDEWLKEPVSEDLKNRIFAQVLPELEDNKRQHLLTQTEPTWGIKFWTRKKAFQFSLIAMAFAGMFYLRTLNIIDVEYPATTFSELASLTPEEFEVIENLDFIDELDNINLDDIRKEMRRKNNKGKNS